MVNVAIIFNLFSMRFGFFMNKFLSSVAIALILSGCAANQSTISKDAQITQNWTGEQLYNEALAELNSGNYTRAIKLYELLRAKPVESRYAELSLLDSAYAYYKSEEHVKALAALARFQKSYPASVHLDYAMYLKGLILFREEQSFMRKLSAQDWSDRDPAANRKAYQAFDELIKKYPNSRYADDAIKRMAQLVDALGGHEIAIARYYAKRGAFAAANNRAQRVVAYHENTRFVEEALAIMIFTYKKMDKPILAEDVRLLLESNFPKSPYLQHDWEADDMPWWRYWK